MPGSLRAAFEAIATIDYEAKQCIIERAMQTVLQIIVETGYANEESGNMLAGNETAKSLFLTRLF